MNNISLHNINTQEDSPVPKQIKRRFLIIALILGGMALYVLLRYFVVMLNPPGADMFASPLTTAERGSIVDRNGRILALQTRMGNITVWRPNIRNLELLASELSPLIGSPEEDIIRIIDNSQHDFLYLKRNADQSEILQIQNLRSQGRLAGINIEPVFSRIYPERTLASQIIGFTGYENTGLAGIEYSFDEDLSPKTGRNGNQVVLTIDTNIQYILEDIAGRAMEQNRAESVMLLAMDPRNGDILGAASLPNFDPNNFRNSTEVTRMDRTAIWAFEPGSTFKVFSVAALLESQAIQPNTIFFCNSEYMQRDRVILSCLRSHGSVNAEGIIVYSCNTGVAYSSDRMGNSPFFQAISNFGFGTRTGAGTPGETAGIFRPVNQWSERTRPTIAMGQEISVSAMQMIQAMTAIANDGILVSPRIVSRIIGDDGRIVREFQSGEARRIISPETARHLRVFMEAGTEDMGRHARVRDLPLGVKTGTGQMIDPVTGAYSTRDYIASCIALLPADNPSLVLYMVLVKPMGPYIFGSRTAAPAIREAAEALIDYLGIPRDRNPQISHTGEITIPTEELIVIGDTIPAFYRRAKSSLVPLLLRDDLQMDIRGEGWVVRQYPPPGTPFQPGMTIILELE